MAPITGAADRLGTVLPEVAEAAGLQPGTPVHCGIHDSNASLYAHLVSREAPFAVVSTGTWVISMAIGGRSVRLDPARDTLINVDARGDPVPSARFMGGREFDRMTGGRSHRYGSSDVSAVLAHDVMLLPAVETHSGPFQGNEHCWTVDENSLSDGQRFVVVSFYLALMTATGLEMTGADGPILVEGPFASNAAYLDMLAAATERPVWAVSGTGTSIGAALLTTKNNVVAVSDGVRRLCRPELSAYAEKWRAAGRSLVSNVGTP